MMSKSTRLSPRNVSDVVNKIIHQISASTKMQIAIFARKRLRYISPKCSEKGKGATSKEDSTKSALQNKSKLKKSKDAKFKKKKRNFKIKFVDTQDEVSADSEISSHEEDNSHSHCLWLLCRTPQRERLMQFWYPEY